MTSQTVLIAAFSGRALAQSARRAGYEPLVADAFGDQDTHQAATHVAVVSDAMEHGFRTKPLVAALDALVQAAPSAPIGLVMGSGLEDKPQLLEFLDHRYGLLGCSVEAVRACKDPRVFFAVLDELGIPHPETRLTPPGNPEGWLSKRIGGSGGRHIRHCTTASRAGPRRYFQRFVGGERLSVSTAIASDGISMAMSRQWCTPSDGQPFRYGGAVSLPDTNDAPRLDILSTVDKLARGLDLRGLVSFDFIVSGGQPYLLEVNPRPGATLDIFDDGQGTLFQAHVAASQGKPLERRGGDGIECNAAAILHADRGAVTMKAIDWPEWAADRGAPGAHIPSGAPLATVFAKAATPDAAEALARQRLAELADLIYGHPS